MLLKNLKNYLRNRRGVASIEAALGTVAILTASALALDLYRLASTQTTTLHAAVTLADTVSRDDQLEAGFVQTLAKFLHQEQFPTSNVVFVVSAVYKSPADPAASPTVLWTETVELGPEDGQVPTLTSCSGEGEISIDTLNNPASPAGRIYHVAQRTRHCRSGVRRADKHCHGRSGVRPLHRTCPRR